MFLRISPSGTISLEDAHNFRQLHVQSDIEVTNAEELATTLAAHDIPVEDGHAWVPRSWFMEQARPFGAAWVEGFEHMTDYARHSGWVDEATQSIRAHIKLTCPRRPAVR